MGELGLGLVSALTQGLPCGFFAHPSSESLVKNRFVRCSRSEPVKQKKTGKKEHHLWMRRELTGSGQKSLHLVQITLCFICNSYLSAVKKILNGWLHLIQRLPNEKEVIYAALDKWTAWETEFPLVAAAKALEILRKRRQWLQIIQITKWLINKGQVLTMGTYDNLLLALDMDGRVDEAESIWNVILQTHTRSVSKRLFSRMIALYEHHNLPDKILEIFADMEELGVTPDEDTVTRIGRAFETLGQNDNRDLLFKKYRKKWKYLHFKGERVKVRATENWNNK